MLIVLEAIGTSWMRLATSLSATGFAVALINPAQAHAFTHLGRAVARRVIANRRQVGMFYGTLAVTRLPLARHTHTGRFGDLMLADRLIAIDQNPAAALTALHHAYRENRNTGLPGPAPPPHPFPQPACDDECIQARPPRDTACGRAAARSALYQAG